MRTYILVDKGIPANPHQVISIEFLNSCFESRRTRPVAKRRLEEWKKRPLAWIVKVMPGKDHVVRVADVCTKTGVSTCPVLKLTRMEEDSHVFQTDLYGGLSL